MRHLYFDAEAGLKDPKETYEMLYDSIVNAPGGYEGIADNRTISRVLDKLESIGTAARRNNQDVFDLVQDDVVRHVSLEDSEFDLVMKVLKSIRWTGTFSRKAVVLFDWVQNAPRELRTENGAQKSQVKIGDETSSKSTVEAS